MLLPPIIVQCAGSIEEFITQIYSHYTYEKEFLRKRALAFGLHLQKITEILDKGRAPVPI